MHQMSVAVKTWLILSFAGFVVLFTAAGVVVWSSTQASIGSARRDAGETVRSVLAEARARGFVNTPASDAEGKAAARFGFIAYEVFDASGQLLAAEAFSPSIEVGTPPAAELLARVTQGENIRYPVRFADGVAHSDSGSATVARVIRGGEFGEEHWLPLGQIYPGLEGTLRLVLSYPDLTGSARQTIFTTAALAAVALFPAVGGLWFLLNVFVSRPVRNVGRRAARIAAGESVRLPADSGDEMGELARAVNLMADALEARAVVDPMTGLYNLRHLATHLEPAVMAAMASGQAFSLVSGDLNRFKSVNDTYGHAVGDLVLKAVGEALREMAGERFTCWRLGGDEFVIGLPSTSGEEARSHATTLESRIAALKVDAGNGSAVRVSIAFGVAAYPEDADSAVALLAIADARMYAAKAGLGDRRRGNRAASAA